VPIGDIRVTGVELSHPEHSLFASLASLASNGGADCNLSMRVIRELPLHQIKIFISFSITTAGKSNNIGIQD